MIVAPPEFRSAPQYRTVAEAGIIDLLLYGWATEIRAAGAASRIEDARAALDRWVATGLACQIAADGSRRFDPAETVNFLKRAFIRGEDSFFAERFVTTGRQLVRGFHPADPAPGNPGRDVPPPPAALGPRRFSVTFARDFDLRGYPRGTQLRLRLPAPIEDAALRDLKIVPVPSDGTKTEFVLTPGRLDVWLTVPPDARATLAAEFSFTAFPTQPNTATPLAAAEAELYTRPEEGIIQVSPRIRALADALSDSGGDAWGFVRAVWNFMLDRLACGVIHYDELLGLWPTDRALETGWYDCQSGSALVVALCRARGIPARIVGGTLLYPAAPTHHYWSEIWVEGRGWIPLDLTCWDLSAGGRDPAWRDYFLGCLDYRMKTQILPRLFTGTPSIRFPPRWHFLPRLWRDGAEVGFFETESGGLIYRDRLSVREASRLPA